MGEVSRLRWSVLAAHARHWIAGVGALVILWSPIARADPGTPASLKDRWTVDWAYQLSVVHKVVSLERGATERVVVAQTTGEQGIVFQSGMVVRPWLDLALELSGHEDFAEARNSFTENEGIRLRRRTTAGLGLVAEFRPWQRVYASRRGWTIRLGARGVVGNHMVSRIPSSLRTIGADPDIVPIVWQAAGYRFCVGSGVSFALQVHAGTRLFEGTVTFIGLGMGGAFH